MTPGAGYLLVLLLVAAAYATVTRDRHADADPLDPASGATDAEVREAIEAVER